MSDNPLVFASIHATILSIIIAFISVYFIYKYQLTQQVEMQAIQEAERINSLYLPGISYLPANPKEFSLPSDIDEVGLAISRISLLAMKNINQMAIDAFKLPSDQKERAKEMGELINIIGHRYPFPTAVERTESGWFQGDQKPIPFDDIRSVQKWSNDMAHIERQLSSLHLIVSIYGYPSEVFSAIPRDSMSEKIGYISDLSIVFKTFLEYTSKSMNIAYNTKHLLQKAKRIRELNLPKWKLICILLITGAVFFSSVGMPILYNKDVPKLFYTYIRIIYYFVAFLVILGDILRIDS